MIYHIQQDIIYGQIIRAVLRIFIDLRPKTFNGFAYPFFRTMGN
jgi:hypothetical protein